MRFPWKMIEHLINSKSFTTVIFAWWPLDRPFSIMLVKLACNATRNSRIKPKEAKIMPDFFKKSHLNFKRCFVLFQTKHTNSSVICSYQQQVILNNCLFIKLGVRIKTFAANSHWTVIFEALPGAGYTCTQPRLAQFCSTSNSYETFAF